MTRTEVKKDVRYYLGLPYTIKIRPDEEGDLVARIEELPGCVAHGATAREALDRLNDAKQLWIEDCVESGQPVPLPVPEEALPSGKWVQRVPRSLHQQLGETAKREGVSLNQFVATVLAKAVGQRAVFSIAPLELERMWEEGGAALWHRTHGRSSSPRDLTTDIQLLLAKPNENYAEIEEEHETYGLITASSD